jgi:hypothetical protein
MEQLAIFISGSIGGVALLIAVALYIRHRRTVARKNRAIFDQIMKNTRLEQELKQTRIEKQMLETLVKDKLEGKENN